MAFRVVIAAFQYSVFRAIIGFQFDVQSHISQFDVQSRILSFRLSEPPSHLRFGIQSRVLFLFGVQNHCLSSFRHSEPSLISISVQSYLHRIFSFGVQSHHHIFAQHSESSLSLLSVGVQSHLHHIFSFDIQSHHTSVSVFRVIIITSSFGVRSHRYHFSVLEFRAILITFSVLAFRAITVAFSVSAFRCHHRIFVRRSEPSSHIRSAFRAIIITSQCRRSEPSSSYFQFRHSEPSRISIGVQSHHHIFAQHSEPSLSLLSVGVQSHPHHIFSFDIQSHHASVSVFRAIIITSSFGVQSPQSHSRFRRSDAVIAFSFGVQSHHASVSVFRAILITFSVLAFNIVITSEFDVQSHFPDFGVQSHYRIFVRRLEPSSSLLSIGVQSHPHRIFDFGIQHHHRFSVRRSTPLHHPFRRSEPHLRFGFQSCLHHLPPHTRHRSYRLHQRLVGQRPGELHDLPYKHGVVTLHAPRTCSHPLITPLAVITHSGYACICTSNQWQQHLLDIARPPPRLISSLRRRGFPLRHVATAPLFIVPPDYYSKSAIL
uniref:Uncharacterized protein n=1 Tax=Vitis vinifera TaxID=29760 RepID=A5BNU3_VITVI|nr:hypothetical protein VITISV_021465 [Vitis vinifera]